ncbi:MAG: toxin [Spirochaetota bacterium]
MTFNWDDQKNRLLKRTRHIGFEEVVVAIQEERVVDIVEHPGEDRYPNQRISLIEHRNYIYAVPFVRNTETGEVFLKTIFPSRRYTRLHLHAKGSANDE